jgi:hypothetical protein
LVLPLFSFEINVWKLERDYGAVDAPADGGGGKNMSVPPPPSKLSRSVQGLLSLILDLNMMRNTVAEIGYGTPPPLPPLCPSYHFSDANKLPLGKLTKEHLKVPITSFNLVFSAASTSLSASARRWKAKAAPSPTSRRSFTPSSPTTSAAQSKPQPPPPNTPEVTNL